MGKYKTLQEFNNGGQIIVKYSDLPVCCPLPNQALWNAHPRVYLPILKTGKVNCPYCGANYILEDFETK